MPTTAGARTSTDNLEADLVAQPELLELQGLALRQAHEGALSLPLQAADVGLFDFTEDAMHAAASGLARLGRATSQTDTDGSAVDLSSEPMAGYRARFVEAISEDQAMPSALAVAHAVAAANDLTPVQRRALLLDFARVLGLDLARSEPTEAPLPARPRSSSSAAPRRGRSRTS